MFRWTQAALTALLLLFAVAGLAVQRSARSDSRAEPALFLADHSGARLTLHNSETGHQTSVVGMPANVTRVRHISGGEAGDFLVAAETTGDRAEYYRISTTTQGAVRSVTSLFDGPAREVSLVTWAITRTGSKVAYLAGFTGDGSAPRYLAVRDLKSKKTKKWKIPGESHWWITHLSWSEDERTLAMVATGPCAVSSQPGAIEGCLPSVSVRSLDTRAHFDDLSGSTELRRYGAVRNSSPDSGDRYITSGAAVSPDGRSVFIGTRQQATNGKPPVMSVEQVFSGTALSVKKIYESPASQGAITSLVMDGKGENLLLRFPGEAKLLRLGDLTSRVVPLADESVSDVTW